VATALDVDAFLRASAERHQASDPIGPSPFAPVANTPPSSPAPEPSTPTDDALVGALSGTQCSNPDCRAVSKNGSHPGMHIFSPPVGGRAGRRHSL
jgi:hypothetical protein